MPALHRFTRHELDATARTLRCEGAPLTLGGRAFDVLLALAEAGGALVTKEQLLQRAWPGLVVEESNVHVQVSALRKLLGAGAIATVAGLGYRLAVPVQTVQTTATPHNLPAARSSFVGRQALLEEAQRRLAQTRLLSLVGIGGTGKTRLALQLATRALPGWSDGVAWVDLAPLDSAPAVAHALAQALGLRPPPDTAPAEAVAGWLRERRALLVLDNAEHLLEPVARLVDELLARTAAVACVVTSREALGLPGEAVFAVPPLALPAPGAPAAQVDEAEAVRLFTERAALAQPGFVLDDARRSVVLDICRRVDGIPLALELAAAQLRLVSPAQLLALLAHEFRLWTGPGRALPRQQTLQAVIGWSVERLAPGEQALLRALSVCNGGAGFDTAQALAGPEAAPETLLAALRRLADFALIAVEGGPAGPAGPRYRVLETVRQFALAKPVTSRGGAPREVLDERHALHHLALAEAHDREVMQEGRGGATLDRLQQEHDNLLQAFAWCDSHTPRSAGLGLRLAAAMRHYWTARGSMRQGLLLTLRALARAAEPATVPMSDAMADGVAASAADQTADAETQGETDAVGDPAADPRDDAAAAALHFSAHWWALCSAAQMSGWAGQAEQATQLGHALLALSQRQGDPAREAMALMLCSGNARNDGRLDEAQRLLEAGRRLAETAGDDKVLADALSHLATLAFDRQDVDAAVDLNQRVLALRRASGHGYRIAVALLNTAVSLMEAGRLDEAAALLREAAALLPAVGSFRLDVYLIEFAASYAGHRGDWAAVAQLLAASGHLRSEQDMPLVPREQGERQTLLAGAQAAMGDAALQTETGVGARLPRAAALARVRQALG
jgi:predicted ATPase